MRFSTKRVMNKVSLGRGYSKTPDYYRDRTLARRNRDSQAINLTGSFRRKRAIPMSGDALAVVVTKPENFGNIIEAKVFLAHASAVHPI
jgi:hypothetical protein